MALWKCQFSSIYAYKQLQYIQVMKKCAWSIKRRCKQGGLSKVQDRPTRCDLQ